MLILSHVLRSGVPRGLVPWVGQGEALERSLKERSSPARGSFALLLCLDRRFLRRADDLLDLHQAAEGRAFLLVQLHADVADRLLQVGDHDVLQRVDAAPGKVRADT